MKCVSIVRYLSEAVSSVMARRSFLSLSIHLEDGDLLLNLLLLLFRQSSHDALLIVGVGHLMTAE